MIRHFVVAVLAMSVLWVGTAWAADAGGDAFVGTWYGKAGETSALRVTISKAGDKFDVKLETVFASLWEGPPKNIKRVEVPFKSAEVKDGVLTVSMDAPNSAYMLSREGDQLQMRVKMPQMPDSEKSSGLPLTKDAPDVKRIFDSSTEMTPSMKGLEMNRQAARTASCQNNLKQFGLVFKMFANESKGMMFPPVSMEFGRMSFSKKDVYPEYLTDTNILVCPEQEVKPPADAKPEALVDWNFAHTSYWFLGYCLPDEKTGLAFVKAYKEAIKKGAALEDTFESDGVKLYRTREGVERFYVKDINDPSAAAKAQAEIPVMVERPENHAGKLNVLFMDGHVITMDYPGKYPASEAFIKALQSLDKP